jgi:chemotaxis protein CheZ
MQNRNELLKRIGHVTRLLHDSLAELGLDKALVKFSSEIPEARDRLSYVSKLTQQSADIVLTATERATPMQDLQFQRAIEVEGQMKNVLSSHHFSDSARAAVEEALAFAKYVQETSHETKQLILSIMMAQDFQDLTGQMIQTMSNLTQTLEHQLAQILLDFTSNQAETHIHDTKNHSLMNGPQIIKPGNSELVTSQAQVDALLDSLGF